MCLNIYIQQSKAGMFTVFPLELWVFYKAFITVFSFFLVVDDYVSETLKFFVSV